MTFPTTRWSAVLATRSRDADERRRAWETLIAAYWKPVYKYVRARWQRPAEDARDATQEFFARMMEGEFLDGYDPERARLRTYLRVCIDGVVSNLDRAAGRQKRGGNAETVSLDFDAAEGELARLGPSQPSGGDELFEREFVRGLFGLAVAELRAQCQSRGKDVQFRVFELYDLEDGAPGEPERRTTYDEIAGELGIAVTDVTNYLAYARREFRRVVLEKLRAMCASEAEFRREAVALLGVDPAGRSERPLTQNK